MDAVNALPEAFYRLDDAPASESTGFSDFRSPQTGLPIPATTIQARDKLGQNHRLLVKYIDGWDRERGPYALEFDARTQYVRSPSRCWR